MAADRCRPIAPPGRAQRGLALVIVLWFLVLMTVMAAGFSLTMRRETELARAAVDGARARAVADAGIQFTLLMLAHPIDERRWRADGRIYEFPLDDARVRIRAYDEAGKFDLNRSNSVLLRGLFLASGLPLDEANALADVMRDWRDRNDLPRPLGAERDQYRRAGLRYSPSNRPFRSLEESRLVLGMTDQLYNRIEPLVTVYAESGGIDPLVASPLALSALPGITPEQVQEVLEQRATEPDPERLSERLQEILDGVDGVAAGGGAGFNAYTIEAEARLPDGATAGIRAVVRRDPGGIGDTPFVFLRWQQSSVHGSLFDVEPALRFEPGLVP